MPMKTGSRSVAYGLVALACIGSLYLWHTQQGATQSVRAILESPQSYDGEHIERLAALGPDAVPAMGQALDEGADFPIVLIYALREIGHPDGAAEVLRFVERQRPYSDLEQSTLTSRAAAVLGDLGDESAIPWLYGAMRSPSAYPRIRLAAAASLVQLDDGDTADEAADFVLDFWESRERYFVNPNLGVAPSELILALTHIQRPEVQSIFDDMLADGLAPALATPALDYMSMRGNPEALSVLWRTVDDSDNYELHVRLAALSLALAHQDGAVAPPIVQRIDALVEEAISDEWDERTIEAARDLQNKYVHGPAG